MRMLKQILLIAAMVPATASAHDFDQDAWLQRWLSNRMDIGECLKLSEVDVPTFVESCDLDTMVTIENRENRVLEVEMLRHPRYNALEFVSDHFADEDDEYIWGIYLNIDATPQFAAILVRLYVAQTLARYITPDIPEGTSSTVDEPSGNNTIHDK
jgi:hypothetical protein